MIANDFIADGGQSSLRRSPIYLGCLVLAKFVRTVGIFIVSDLLKLVHVVQLLLLMKICCSIPLVILQRPFSRGRKLGHRAMRVILQHSLLSCVVHVLWFYGITLCGAFRSILLFENSPLVVATSLGALFKSNGSPSKMRGALLFFFGYLSCILIDRDSSIPHAHSETHSHHSGLNHIFYHIVHWVGVADHKGGVLVMLIAMLLHTALDVFGHHAATEVGGAKRLNAASTFVSVILLTPWAAWTAFSQTILISSWAQFLFLACVSSLIVFLVDFYLDSFCHARLDASVISRVVPVAMFLSALGLSVNYAMLWNAVGSEGYDVDSVMPLPHAEHAISGGAIFTMVLFLCATFILTAPTTPKSRAGQFIGYSNAGLPLYVYGEDLFHRTSNSISMFVKNTLKQVLSSSDSRRIFYFLCANLAFTFVEFLYGFWTNSLGLISDGFHMMFDCSALVMGLVASVMSTWPSTRVFSYGYGRVETLSGFINGLFLLTVSFFIFIEAIERAFDPPDIVTEKLLPVSVAGLVVNLFGIFVFSDAHGHSHGGGGSAAPASEHSHGEGHGHSHGDSGTGHGHSHDNGLEAVVSVPHHEGHGHAHGHTVHKPQSHGHSHANANMEGVFLHVLADTLGSVAVIVSTLLINYFGWLVADPICSLMVAMLIFASVLPLLKNAAKILLQQVPPEMEEGFVDALAKILQVEGVISYSRPHLWQQKPESYVATVHVQITEESHQQRIIQQVGQLLRTSGVKNVTVQVEKNSFYQYMTGLAGSFQMPSRTSRMPLQQSLMVQAI